MPIFRNIPARSRLSAPSRDGIDREQEGDMEDRWRDEDRYRRDPDHSGRAYGGRGGCEPADGDHRGRSSGRPERHGDGRRGTHGMPHDTHASPAGGGDDDARHGNGQGDYGGAYGTHRRQGAARHDRDDRGKRD
ncbi:hypothetical protein O4J55_16955 [Paracoccus sp. PXZ]